MAPPAFRAAKERNAEAQCALNSSTETPREPSASSSSKICCALRQIWLTPSPKTDASSPSTCPRAGAPWQQRQRGARRGESVAKQASYGMGRRPRRQRWTSRTFGSWLLSAMASSLRVSVPSPFLSRAAKMAS